MDLESTISYANNHSSSNKGAASSGSGGNLSLKKNIVAEHIELALDTYKLLEKSGSVTDNKRIYTDLKNNGKLSILVRGLEALASSKFQKVLAETYVTISIGGKIEQQRQLQQQQQRRSSPGLMSRKRKLSDCSNSSDERKIIDNYDSSVATATNDNESGNRTNENKHCNGDVDNATDILLDDDDEGESNHPVVVGKNNENEICAKRARTGKNTKSDNAVHIPDNNSDGNSGGGDNDDAVVDNNKSSSTLMSSNRKNNRNKGDGDDDDGDNDRQEESISDAITKSKVSPINKTIVAATNPASIFLSTIKSLSNPNDKMARHQQRLRYIPDEFAECTSAPTLMAIALYCVYDCKTNVIAKILMKIADGSIRNVRELFAITSNPLHTVLELLRDVDDKDYHAAMESKNIRIHISYAMMKACSILRDKTLSMTIMDLDAESYIALLEQSTYKFNFNAFYAALTKWSNTCVPPGYKKEKFLAMQDRFDVNPRDTIYEIVRDLRLVPTQEETQSSRKKYQRPVFEESREYYVFSKGHGPFYSDLHPTYRSIGDDTYQLIEYKGCVYDVLSINDKALNDLDWKARLNKIDYPRVTLERVNGDTLNNEYDNQIIGVSWIDDDGKSYYKLCNMRKK